MNNWMKICNEGTPFGVELIDSIIDAEFEYCSDVLTFEMHSDQRLAFRRLMDSARDWGHLLELRVYDGHKELKIWRPGLGDEFYGRVASETDMENCFFEDQYLNIDSFRDQGNGYYEITSVGGGRYTGPDTMPISHKDCMLTVCNYLDYHSESGQAEIVDWRIIGFKKGN